MREVDLSVTYIYIIDDSLGLSKGKIAAQVSHVAMELADENRVLGRAFVLKADHETFMKLFKYPNVKYVLDAGLTEVPKNTMTCIGFKQTPFMKQLTDKLKLV
jgi:peptidyl-tRNA hydrolase